MNSSNEKFTEDGDPIRDMGIGIFIKKDFKDVKTCLKFIMIAIPAILNTEVIPRNIVPAYKFGHGIQPNYYRKIQDFLDKYWTFNGKKFDGSVFDGNGWPWELREELLKRGFKKSSKLLREQYQVNEKFTEEDSDPIRDMNIGMFQIKKVFLDPKKAASFLITILPKILKKEEIPKDILIRRSSSKYMIRGEYIVPIIKYAQKYIINKSRSSEPDLIFQCEILIELEDILTEMGYRRKRKKIKESLDEKFTEESDPIHDLGIGNKFTRIALGDIIVSHKTDFYFSEKSTKPSHRRIHFKKRPNTYRNNIKFSYYVGVVVKVKHDLEHDKLTLYFVPFISNEYAYRLKKEILKGIYIYDAKSFAYAINYGIEKYEDWADYFKIIE